AAHERLFRHLSRFLAPASRAAGADRHARVDGAAMPRRPRAGRMALAAATARRRGGAARLPAACTRHLLDAALRPGNGIGDLRHPRAVAGARLPALARDPVPGRRDRLLRAAHRLADAHLLGTSTPERLHAHGPAGRDRDFCGDSANIPGMNWFTWALLSAIFAGITAILAKMGVAGVDSNLATAVRTAVVL